MHYVAGMLLQTPQTTPTIKYLSNSQNVMLEMHIKIIKLIIMCHVFFVSLSY